MTSKRKTKPFAKARAQDKAQTGEAERAESSVPTDEAALLQNRLAELQGEYERAAVAWREREDQLLRLFAENENRLKRLGKEAEWDRQRYRGDLITPLLAVLDDLERALAQKPEGDDDPFAAGVTLIAERFSEALAGLGLRPIAALGEKFNPNLHEAMMQVADADAAKGQIIQEIQKGYTLGDRVLRPSKVAVSG